MIKNFYVFIILIMTSMQTVADEVWLYSGGDMPAFKLVLKENGRAEFVDGFIWLNPMEWERKGDYLTLHINKMDETIFNYMQYAIKIDDGCLSSVNRTTIVYYEELCEYIDVGGYFFYQQ